MIHKLYSIRYIDISVILKIHNTNRQEIIYQSRVSIERTDEIKTYRSIEVMIGRSKDGRIRSLKEIDVSFNIGR